MDDDFNEFIEHIYINLEVPRIVLRDMENPLERFSNNELIQRYRFGRNAINNILLLIVYPEGMAQTNRGLPIPPVIKLCTALRFYASGSHQRVCGDLVHISQSSSCRIVAEVSQKLVRHLQRFIHLPTSPAAVARNRRDFYEIARFPGVIGCVDGTHVEIKSPGGENAEVFRNRKGYFSLNIQVVAGADLKILDIVIRWPGSAHDSRIFNNSAVCLRLERGEIQGILLGDSAYQQTRYMYTPVPNPNTPAEQRYNTAHISTRNTIERTFGVWKSRFRCIANCLNYNLRNTTRIIAATAILHNIAVNEEHHIENIHIEQLIPNVPAQEASRGNVIRANFINRHFL